MNDWLRDHQEQVEHMTNVRLYYDQLKAKNPTIEELQELRQRSTRVSLLQQLSRKYPRFTVLEVANLAEAAYEAAERLIKELEAASESDL